jgi:hypothetical protein
MFDPDHMHPTAGYHIATITKGELGTLSKIREELEEAEDANRQGCGVMLLVELSDMIGAIEAFLEVQFPHQNLDDLICMSRITQRAFRNGHRT